MKIELKKITLVVELIDIDEYSFFVYHDKPYLKFKNPIPRDNFMLCFNFTTGQVDLINETAEVSILSNLKLTGEY